MTVNVRLDEGTVTVIPESVIQGGLEARQENEDINVMERRGAILVVYPDGASVDEIERLVAAAEARASDEGR